MAVTFSLSSGSIAVLCSLLVSVEFVELHGPDKQVVFVNVNEVSTLRSPLEFDLRKHFTKGTRCVVVTTNGKFIAVVENCSDVRKAIERSK